MATVQPRYSPRGESYHISDACGISTTLAAPEKGTGGKTVCLNCLVLLLREKTTDYPDGQHGLLTALQGSGMFRE